MNRAAQSHLSRSLSRCGKQSPQMLTGRRRGKKPHGALESSIELHSLHSYTAITCRSFRQAANGARPVVGLRTVSTHD
eukprot:2366904-Prymnesium_polylepis.1